ncbi:MAG: SlyX family protein [Planctomycetaceae bacterium]|nr:SlyX family protein [Planctomycetaceae bacterium]
MTESAPNSDFLQRANQLESLFTHLEKTVQDLDEVVIDGHQQFEELKQRVERLEEVVQEPPVDAEIDLDPDDQ